MALAVAVSSSPTVGNVPFPTIIDKHDCEASQAGLGGIFQPSSVASERSRDSPSPSVPVVKLSNSGDHPSLAPTNSPSPPPHRRTPLGRTRVENGTTLSGSSHNPKSQSCCRRCGREIPPGGKRNVVALATPPRTYSIAEVTRETAPRVTSPPPAGKPTVGEDRKEMAAMAAAAAPPRVTVVQSRHMRPLSAASSNSQLVERTRGIMATLSPSHITSSPPSISSLNTKPPAVADTTFPRTARPNPLSKLISRSMPNQSGDRRSRTHPPLYNLTPVNLSAEMGWVEREGTRPHMSSLRELPVIPNPLELPEKVEVEDSGFEHSPVRESIRPTFLELPHIDNASTFTMTDFLRTVFEEETLLQQEPQFDLVANRVSRGTSQGDVVQENTSQKTVSQDDASQEDVSQEDVSQEDYSQEDVNQEGNSPSESDAHAWDSREYVPEPTTPMVFFEDDGNMKEDASSVRLKGKRYRSWNPRARRASRKSGKLTAKWTPPESWGGPAEPIPVPPALPTRLHPFKQSSNTVSSLDEAPLKPLTYLVHHRKTSSVDVCSTSDHQDSKKTSGSEDDVQASVDARTTSEAEDVLVKTRQPRLPRSRKSVWQESAVLEVIPKLRELKLGKNKR